MAAPEYVPVDPVAEPRAYRSTPRRDDSWMPTRPAEVVDGYQPRGEMFGNPGPDQGYALVLLRRFHGKLFLTEGEDEHDAMIGCLGVALKRASLFGRAPVVHDLTVAFTIWGFLDDNPDRELVALRRPLFQSVGHSHHYVGQREIVDAVPDDVLRRPHAQVIRDHATNWRSLLNL